MSVNKKRNAVTLLELIAVMTLIGIMSTLAISRYSGGTRGAMGAQTDMRKMLTDMMLARREAISTGHNHRLGISRSGYVIQRIDNKSGSVSNTTRSYTFSEKTTVRVVNGNPEFNFQGQALSGTQVTLSSAGRSWRLRVIPLTGHIDSFEL